MNEPMFRGPGVTRVFWVLVGLFGLAVALIAVGSVVENFGGMATAMVMGGMVTVGLLGFIAWQVWRMANKG